MIRKIIKTLDGSVTFYVPELEEHYHSTNGAITESKHVFIDAGFKQINKSSINILEIGFGTGLNSLITLIEASKAKKEVNYTGIEKFPVQPEEVELLNYHSLLKCDKKLFTDLHSCEWEKSNEINKYFFLKKIENDLNDTQLNDCYDLIYFDAFAPDKQDELWNIGNFRKIFNSLTNQGILTTYCAKGSVKRLLLEAGFKVNKLPGPPGKREMIQAIKEF